MARATVGQIWRDLQKQLEDAGVAPAPREGQAILAAALACEMADLRIYEDAGVTDAVMDTATGWLARRMAGEPLAYVLGKAPFWNHDWLVGEGVLIPRPDSEVLVNEVLSFQKDKTFILEIGLGSGALLGSVLDERAEWRGVGVEPDIAARAWAEKNLSAMVEAGRVEIVDTLSALGNAVFDVVFSNPPYISDAEWEVLDDSVKAWEPKMALTGDCDNVDGLACYRDWVPMLVERLGAGGLLAMEIGHMQGAAVCGIFEAAGLRDVRVVQDLGGRDRVVRGVQ